MNCRLGRTLLAFIVAVVALVALSVLGMQAATEPQGTVLLQNDSGTAEGYTEGMADDYVVASALRGGDNQYPLRVQKVQARFYRDFAGANNSVYARAVVYDVGANGYPQGLLAASAPMTITTFYPQFVDLALLEPVLLTEPQTFIAGIEYLSGVRGSTPSLLTDNTDNVTERKNFYSRDAGQTWYEHHAFWQTPLTVGYNMVRAWVETNVATPTGSPTATRTPTPTPTATATLEVLPEALWPGYIIGYSKQHTLARGPDGRLHLVYFNLGHRALYYAWSNDNGATWQPPLDARSPFHTFAEPGGGGSVAVDPDGATLHLLIGQDPSTTNGTGGINGALYFRYHDGEWSTPERVANNGYAYNLAVGPDGRVHIAWSFSDIWYRVRAVNGQWGPERRLANGGWHPDIDVGPNGQDVHIAYNDNDYCCAATWVEVRYLHSNDGGATWAAPERLTNDQFWSGSVAGAVDDRGRYHLTYLVSGRTQGDVYYRRRESTGVWSAPESLFQGVIISQTGAGSPALESDAAGNLAAVMNCLDANHVTHVCLQVRDDQRGWQDVRQLLGTISEQSGLAGGKVDFGCVNVVWNARRQTAYRCITDVVIQPTPTPTSTPTPTPGAYHARVVDERGTPRMGARVYRNGVFMGQTRGDGVLDLPSLMAGDELIALAPLPLDAAFVSGRTARSGHDKDLDGLPADPWAFQVFLTNLQQSPDLGPQHPGLVSDVAPGERRLVVHRDSPLIFFNLTVSLEWDADRAYLDDLETGLRQASAFFYDVTDGQMALGRVTIFDRGEHWRDADIRIAANNQIVPHAAVAGMDSSRIDHTARFGPLWNGDSSRRGGVNDDCPSGAWSCSTGYRTLVHELGHYLLGLYDEYIRFPPGGHPQDAYCTHPEQATNPPPEPNRASIMDYQYDASELADKFQPELWSEACTRTEQWDRTGGESDWDTLLRRFHAADGAPALDCRPGAAVPPNTSYCLWRPAGRGQVLPQPEPRNWPVERVWPWPAIDRQASPDGPPVRMLHINWRGATNPDQSYQLRTVIQNQQGGPIEQGLTHPVDHSIDLFGVAEGATLMLHTLDRRLEATLPISTTGDITLTLVNPRPAVAVADQTALQMALTPQADGQGLRVELRGGGQEELWVEYALAGGSPERVRLHTEGGLQSAILPVDLRFRTSGKIAILASDGQPVGPHLSASFVGRGLPALAPADIYAPDGRLWLHLGEGQAPGDMFVIVSVLGALTDGLPHGWLPGGQVYAVSYAGGSAMPSGQIRLLPDCNAQLTTLDGEAALLGRAGPGLDWTRLEGVEMGEDGSLVGVWGEGFIVAAWRVRGQVFLPMMLQGGD